VYAPDNDLNELTQFRKSRLWEEGLNLTHTLLRQFPHDGRVWELSGLIYRDITSYELARGALETANTLIPLSDEAQLALADCYAHAGRFSLARDICEFLLEKEHLAPELLPRIERRLKQLPESEFKQSHAEYQTSHPDLTAEHHYNLAYYMGYVGYPEENIEREILEAIRLAPECVEYRIGLAGFLSQVNRAEEGYQYVAQLSLVTISRLHCECCLERLIKVYQAGGDHDRLISCLNRSEELKQARSQGSLSDDSY